MLRLGRSLGGGRGNPLQYSCLENPHGQRSLAGCNPGGHKESDMAERLSTAHTEVSKQIKPLPSRSSCSYSLTQERRQSAGPEQTPRNQSHGTGQWGSTALPSRKKADGQNGCSKHLVILIFVSLLEWVKRMATHFQVGGYGLACRPSERGSPD